ncbi:MAG: DUF5668 domain-containing protein [Candidatus Thermoplasmatota archaeon]
MFTRNTQRTGFDWSSFNWWGLFILIIGVLWLGDELEWFNFDWSMMAPIALVFAGIMAFLPKRR